MSIAIDRESLLAHASGEVGVSELERALGAEGLTLDLSPAPGELTVAEWIGAGGPGARSPWLDPADHVLAGFEARLPSGELLAVRPAPRRAVGPDLLALFWGLGGRFGQVVSAHLRVHRAGVPRARTAPFAPPDRPLDDSEVALLEAIAGVLRR